MRKSTIAIGIAAALSTQAFVSTTNADAAVKFNPKKASGPVHSLPHFVFPHRSPNGGGVLFDQSGTAVNGGPSQNFESSFDQYDSQGADDFVVTDAAGWTLSGFNFQVSATSDPSSATYDIVVLPDAAGLPGASPVCSYPAAAGVLDGSNTSLSVTLPSPCVLAQGTYWIEMVVNLDFTVGGQVFWSDFSGGSGANAKWQNPGGGFGTTCSTWSDMANCGSPTPVGGGETAFLFQVLGAVGGTGGGCGAGQLCLVSTVGTDTTAGACATTDTIDVTQGDSVNFCYTITNNTGIELDYHTLTNNVDGTLFSLMNQPVPDGGTFQYNNIENVNATATYNSTWTGQDVPPGYLAEVTSGGGGCPDRIFADGFDPTPTPPCPGGGFVDITGTGTPLGLADDGVAGVTMPFSFNFYGTTSNAICVANNGFVFFNQTSCPTFGPYTNVSLPAASLGATFMPMWDDFDSESGNVYTDTRGTTPNRQFIVEWFDRVHFSGSSNTDGATFELILNEDGTINFEYNDVEFTGGLEAADCSGGACATIGLQNDASLFNQFSAFEASVTDGSGIKWTATAPQVFTGTDSATVNVGAPIIVINPSPITGTVPAGGSSTIPFAVENQGNRDLNWSLQEAGPADKHFPTTPRFAMGLGDASKSTLAPAPIALRRPAKPGAGHHNAIHAPLGGGVPVFAADIYNNNFETFDALTPGTVNIVSPTDGTAYVGGAFIEGDFSTFYAIAGNFAANPDDLFTVDTATGNSTLVGSATNNLGEGYSGLSWDPVSGNLYAASASCGSASHLWIIDPNTGAPTAVGEITGAPCVVAIAVDSAGDMYGLDIVNDALFAIDKTSGNATLVGSIGFNANYAQDMAFDLSTDVLYYAGFDGSAFTDMIYTVDLTSGLATPVGNIGAGLEEVDAMSIETAGGPCSQPQDLPWLSLSPLTGTTAPAGSTPITASIDGTGTVDGDVLSGTVCAASNDPNNHNLATPITVTVGGGGGGNVVDSGVINLSPNPDFTGLYINWLTGDWCTSSGGPCNFAGGYDFNPWNSTLTFFWPGDNSGVCVASDSLTCDVLSSGAVVGPGSTFAGGSSANYLGGNSTGFLGFSFVNANTLATNYGYAKFTTTAGSGYPATLVEYWYDNSGAAINIP